MKMLKWMAALWAVAMLAACGGGGGSSGTSPFGGGSSGGTTTPTMSISITGGAVSTAAPATVAAKVLDASGNPVAAQVVSFVSTLGLGSFSAATALTDASGTATVQLTPAAGTAAGADTVVATATVSGAALTASIGFQSAGGAVSTPTTAASVDVLTSGNQMGSGGDTVTITATVKDAGNVGLASEAVAFSSSSGNLTGAAATTDANGVATATLSAGADKSNRTIVVTVSAGTISGKVSVEVTGTTLSVSGATTVGLSKTQQLSIKATDSKSAAIANVPIQVISSLGNGLSAATLTTDNQGTASLSYTATRAGNDTLTFSGAGTSINALMTVSGEDFVFTSPSPNVEVPVGQSQTVQVRYLAGGIPQAGRQVSFSSTAGTITPLTATTNASGFASAVVSSATASSAVVQASLQSGLAQATLPVTFIATVPSALVLQVTPSAIGPNTNGSTSQQSQLIATVKDGSGNPVKGVAVNFTRLADPSGGSLSQASATTDASGQATVQYIAGALSTASDGVSLRATVASATGVFADAKLTVNRAALFIALGTSNVISNLNPETYQKDWTVYVTDANGAVVPNVSLTMRVLPVAYGKGRLTYSTAASAWVKASPNYVCANEDVNYNGVLDAGEDIDGDGKLQPGNVISVTPGTITTDSSGRATISLLYAESYVPWVVVTLEATAVVAGTESSTQATFQVPGVASDFTDQNVPPAGATSPFGVNVCTVPN